jgi:hypothetical protein
MYNNIVVASKSQDPNSPYTEVMQKLAASFQKKMLQDDSSPDVVAKVVLEAATSENPSPKYLAGKDIETWMEAKRSMSDEEFYKMMEDLGM